MSRTTDAGRTSSPASGSGTRPEHDETNHVPLRSADCQRCHRAAGAVRHHLHSQSAAGHGIDSQGRQRGWRIRSPKRSASTCEHNNRVLRRSGSCCAAPIWSPGSRRACSRTTSIDFPEFREITFFGAGGRVIATSRAAETPLRSRPPSRRHQRRFHSSPRSRRGQPAANDDCRPHRSRRAGARLGCR